MAAGLKRQLFCVNFNTKFVIAKFLQLLMIIQFVLNFNTKFVIAKSGFGCYIKRESEISIQNLL